MKAHGDFERMGLIQQLQSFKERLEQSKTLYKSTLRQFNDICKQIDVLYEGESDIKNLELELLTPYIDDIDAKIEKISDLIEKLKHELKQN